jgi:hypothetical protein
MTNTNSEISLIPKSPAEVAKAILFIVVGLAAYLKDAISGGISPIEAEQLVVTFVTLVPLYLLAGTMVKTITVFASAALQALAVPIAALVGWQAWSHHGRGLPQRRPDRVRRDRHRGRAEQADDRRPHLRSRHLAGEVGAGHTWRQRRHTLSSS